MLWKSYHVGASFEFLRAQNNFPSKAHTRGQRGEGGGGKCTSPKVRRLSEIAGPLGDPPQHYRVPIWAHLGGRLLIIEPRALGTR